MNNNIRNCRCCLSSYDKQSGYWCKIPITNNGKLIEPVGFCEFCDRNNETWYIHRKIDDMLKVDNIS